MISCMKLLKYSKLGDWLPEVKVINVTNQKLVDYSFTLLKKYFILLMQKLLFILFIAFQGSLFAQKIDAPTKSTAKPATTTPAPKLANSTTGSKPGNTPGTIKSMGADPAAARAAAAKKDTSIVKFFEKPADLKWVRYFKGRLDDATVVNLTLGFDGRNCRGYLTYEQSSIRFNLSGLLDTAGFALEEQDMARNLTGRLIGNFNNRRLEADWINADNTIGRRLEAEEINAGQTQILNCSDNKWSSRYITRFNGARCDMVLVRSYNGALDGFLWVESDARTYKLKGEIKNDGTYEMEVLGSGDGLAALLSGNLKPGQNLECNWVGSGERRSFKFILKDNFQLGCYEYADYASSYDILYPNTPCTYCNAQLNEKVSQWVARCKTSFSEKKIALTPANRCSQRASAWPEIVSWTDNLLAGYVTFTDTWTDQAQGISFNYDLRTNKEIILDDLFNKGFNAQKYLIDWANREMPKLSSFASDPKYREWLNKEGFPLFALRREGLEISTLFHPQYGRQTLLVPYSGLKAYFKKDSPVWEFLK